MTSHEVLADRDTVLEVAQRARHAAVTLAPLARAPKDAAIRNMAEAIVARSDGILAANQADVNGPKLLALLVAWWIASPSLKGDSPTSRPPCVMSPNYPILWVR